MLSRQRGGGGGGGGFRITFRALRHPGSNFKEAHDQELDEEGQVYEAAVKTAGAWQKLAA